MNFDIIAKDIKKIVTYCPQMILDVCFASNCSEDTILEFIDKDIKPTIHAYKTTKLELIKYINVLPDRNVYMHHIYLKNYEMVNYIIKINPKEFYVSNFLACLQTKNYKFIKSIYMFMEANKIQTTTEENYLIWKLLYDIFDSDDIKQIVEYFYNMFEGEKYRQILIFNIIKNKQINLIEYLLDKKLNMNTQNIIICIIDTDDAQFIKYMFRRIDISKFNLLLINHNISETIFELLLTYSSKLHIKEYLKNNSDVDDPYAILAKNELKNKK